MAKSEAQRFDWLQYKGADENWGTNKLHFNSVKIYRDINATGPDALKRATYRKYMPKYYDGDRYGRVKVCYYENEPLTELLPGVENLSPELHTIATEITDNLQLMDLKRSQVLGDRFRDKKWTGALRRLLEHVIARTPTTHRRLSVFPSAGASAACFASVMVDVRLWRRGISPSAPASDSEEESNYTDTPRGTKRKIDPELYSPAFTRTAKRLQMVSDITSIQLQVTQSTGQKIDFRVLGKGKGVSGLGKASGSGGSPGGNVSSSTTTSISSKGSAEDWKEKGFKLNDIVIHESRESTSNPIQSKFEISIKKGKNKEEHLVQLLTMMIGRIPYQPIVWGIEFSLSKAKFYKMDFVPGEDAPQPREDKVRFVCLARNILCTEDQVQETAAIQPSGFKNFILNLMCLIQSEN